MSFLTNQPDLSETIYAGQAQYLQEIRDFLVAEIEKVAPGWPDDPIFGGKRRDQTLRAHWESDETYSTCYLIWIASILKLVIDRVTLDSIPLLREKFKALLNAGDPKQYIQYLTELEVAAAFVARVSPLLVDPLAFPEGLGVTSDRAPSSDFAFDIAGERIYIEVTTFTIEELEKWQKAADEIVNILQKRLLKKGRHLKLHVQLPLQLIDTQRVIKRAWEKICASEGFGTLTVVPGGTIRWEPYPLQVVQEDAPPLMPGVGNMPGIYPTPNGGWEVLFRFQHLTEITGLKAPVF